MTKQKTQRFLKNPAQPGSVPQTADAAAAAIAEIGTCQRARQVLEAEMNEQIAKIKEDFETRAKPHNERITTLRDGVQIYCEANRVALTKDGKVKFASFTTGEVRWRMTPPKVSVKAVEETIKLLVSKSLSAFLRTKTEINKEAILADGEAAAKLKRAGIAGITISQGEEFVIEPFETKLEEVV
jgi:phage host-nuclease inhibitor protein Gam